MAWYTYAYKAAFDPTTQQLAANATGEVFAVSDTQFTNPIPTFDLTGIPVTLTSTGLGFLPEFQVEDHVEVLWKSGDYVFHLNTTTPITGPAGTGVAAAELSGDALTFTLDNGTALPPVTLPTGPGGSDDGVASYVETEESATAQALGARFTRRGELVINVKDFGAVEDGVTDDTAAIQAAVTAAQGQPLLIAGTPLITGNIAGLHGAILTGPGRIIRDGISFYARPTGTQKNILHVASSGSDTNDGLTPALSFKTFQAAFDALKLYGPILDGLWEVVAAGGTYPINAAQQTLTVRSTNRVVVRGAAVGGHPNVPITIINGAGGAAYKHGLSASGIGVRVEFRDLKFINFTAGAGDTSRIGCLGENEADAYFVNVHATGASWTGIYAFNTVRSRVQGGILEACRSGYIANDTQSTVAETIVKNCTESGIYWSRGSQGHVDYVTFEGNAIGLRVAESSRVDTVANNFKRNAYAIRTQTGGVFGEGGAPNIFNVGTADANTQSDVQYAANSGDSKELEASQQYVRVAYDRTARTHTGTTAQTTLTTPYTIPARRLAGVGKQARVHVLGIMNTVTAGSAVAVTFGGMSVNFVVPGASSSAAFEIDVELLEVTGGYRAIGRISQGLNLTRFATSGGGFDTNTAQDVTVRATLSATGDSISVYRTDVYLMG